MYFTAKGGITKSLGLVSGGNRVGCTQEENEPQGLHVSADATAAQFSTGECLKHVTKTLN